MSDMIPTPFDAAIDLLRERERQLDTEAQSLIIRRDEVREMIAVLTSRKPRIRKPRAVTEAVSDDERRRWARGAAPCATEVVPDAADETPRPTVFATPCLGDVPQEAA
jgi:hypothetical protein